MRDAIIRGDSVVGRVRLNGRSQQFGNRTVAIPLGDVITARTRRSDPAATVGVTIVVLGLLGLLVYYGISQSLEVVKA